MSKDKTEAMKRVDAARDKVRGISKRLQRAIGIDNLVRNIEVEICELNDLGLELRKIIDTPEKIVVDHLILDLIGRCDDGFVIEYEYLFNGEWGLDLRKAGADDFSPHDIGANRITRATLDAIKAHVAEREQWVELFADEYDILIAVKGGMQIRWEFRRDSAWNKTSSSIIELVSFMSSGGAAPPRMLRTEWAKVEAHLAEMVELPDDLIPPNTQIVGGVDVCAYGDSLGVIVFRDADGVDAQYTIAYQSSVSYTNPRNITLSRLDLHRLKTGEIEMRAIKFEEDK